MRNIWLALILFSAASFAQAPDSTRAGYYTMNFSVPDIPAFKGLGIEPSNMLRPSDVKKFSVSMNPFYSNGQAVIPKNFAMEFAPWKLLAQKWTVEEYNNHLIRQLAYNSAFSIGSIRDSGTYNSRLSVGYRLSVGDKRADPVKARCKVKEYMDIIAGYDSLHTLYTHVYNEYLYNYARLSSAATDSMEKKYLLDHKADFTRWIDSISSADLPNSALKKEALVFRQRKGNYLEAVKDIGTDAATEIRNFRNRYWNANRFDLAVAWTGESPDTLLKNARFSSFNAWATLALRCRDKGQLLLGLQLRLPRSDSSRVVDFSGGTRYYFGNPDLRCYVEGQYRYNNMAAVNVSLLGNVGAEFRVGSSFWLVVSGGVNTYLDASDAWSKFVGSMNLRYGFN